MSEIEKAIKACKEEVKFYKNELKQPYLKEHLSTYEAYVKGQNEAYSKCVDGIEIFEFIISVLKEKQQREHGCEYCNSEPGMMPYSGNNRGEFYFDSGEISYEYENSYCSISDSVSINYCPMCGRRLSHE